jgi:hypothetical protein
MCPKCGSPCGRDEVHNGVAMLYGPYGCGCGWSEDDAYDLTNGRNPMDARGGFTDQYGNYHPPGSAGAIARRG